MIFALILIVLTHNNHMNVAFYVDIMYAFARVRDRGHLIFLANKPDNSQNFQKKSNNTMNMILLLTIVIHVYYNIMYK